MRFTDAKLRSLAPRGARYDVQGDGTQGLVLRVEPTGRKTWYSVYKFKGRLRRMTLGVYMRGAGFPVRVSLAAAQAQHRQALEQVDRGIDPGLERREQFEARKRDAEQRKTIEQLLDEYERIEIQHLKSGAELMRLLRRDMPESWLHRHADSIAMREVVLLIDDIRLGRGRTRPVPSTADHFHSALVRLFAFAAERGVVPVSPVAGLRRRGKRPPGRARVLNDAERASLFARLRNPADLAIEPYVADALLFLLITGQRPGEVSGMAWSEVEGSVWTIPADRYKTRTAHAVPLSPLALEILARRRQDPVAHKFAFPDYRGVFPKRTANSRGRRVPEAGGQRPLVVSALSRAMRRNREGLGLESPATPHDLRRTMRTGLSALKVDYITAELVVGHRLPTRMGQVYDRFDYLDSKREALERWAAALSSVVEVQRAAA